jgi:hypothetical protein
MAGTLDINDSAVWMPAGWVFDGVMELVASELQKEDPSLAAALLAARTQTDGYGDLRPLNPSRFRSLLRAAEIAFKRHEEQGPSAFHEPSFYSGFNKNFNQFIRLLRSDPRASAG